MASNQEKAINKAIKAVNRPALYRKVAKRAIEIDSVRGEEMGNLVIGGSADEKMRELVKRFIPSGLVGEGLEDAIDDRVQLVAAVIAATRESRAA
jgi:hypothetical protein